MAIFSNSNAKLSLLALSTVIALSACDGDDGEPGAPGQNGTPGSNGLSSLTITSIVNPGSDECPEGGVSISTGLDNNSDGTLADDEVDDTRFVCGSQATTSSVRNLELPAPSHMLLAEGLNASFLTREVGNHADQFSFYPAENPTHMMACIESVSEVIVPDSGKMNPGVQRINLADGTVETILRGMSRCDGIRTTAWGTILATEEAGDGAAYEIIDPLTTTEVTITERGEAGADATILNADGTAATTVAKRNALPTMAWEGLTVLDNGIVIGGDELRPGSFEFTVDNAGTDVGFGEDTDGGAIFKFIPTDLRTEATTIASLDESPLVAGSTFALQVSCRDSRQQFGQGCEVGNAAWIAIADQSNAREEANRVGATGYYRPEDLHIDPDFSDADNPEAIRFCWANTGNRGASNWGEVVCGVDSAPNAAEPDTRSVIVNRFLEGDEELNAPDNLAFQPGTGILYVIEDNRNGDVWACLPDGADRDVKSDGCVRVLSLNDRSAEPTGFIFNADGTEAYVSIQHSNDDDLPLFDDFRTDDIVRITGFGDVQATPDNRTVLLNNDTDVLFGFDGALTQSASFTVDRPADIAAAGLDIAAGDTGFGQDASDIIDLAPGLTATFLTRGASEWTDQFEFYPATNPTHLVSCVEETRGIVNDGTPGKYKPSVQTISLTDGTVRTVLRGMSRCDGIRVTDWGTVLATEETGDGAAYEILDVLASENVTITERGDAGEAATIVDGINGTVDASSQVIKRTNLPTIAWEGLEVLSSGVVIAADELRPGSYTQFFFSDGTVSDEDDGTEIASNDDTDGGAVYKFIPETLRTSTAPITSLTESPLTAGTTYALQMSCRDSRQQAGQGCEIGNGAWIEVDEDNARVEANIAGATGFYRPEDLHIDPTFSGTGVRFCWANTGNAGARNYGEVVCGVDSQPNLATAEERTVVINRLLEGDPELNAPDNVAFQPVTGMTYVIEDRSNGDVWACLPDGADRDIKTDGCVRMLSIGSQSAEPTGFIFSPDGTEAYVSIQHAAGTVLFDGNDTDDMIRITGFDTAVSNSLFGIEYENNLHVFSQALFGFEGPLTQSSTSGQ
ncbi:DUF839 domain-containing protein [Alteromonadaceae bacterium M269]|nr:DUF839 domain-containing protein [Alteromonadaceae bacterium M269]